MIPYGGVVVTLEEGESLRKSACKKHRQRPRGGEVVDEEEEEEEELLVRNTKADYLLDVSATHPGRMLDAHPSRYPLDAPLYGWLGSLVNEPSVGERANAVLMVVGEGVGEEGVWEAAQRMLVAKAQGKGYYPQIHHDVAAYVVLEVEVEKGEEITALYHYSKKCHKRLGYEVGLGCFEQAEPGVAAAVVERSKKQHAHSMKNLNKIRTNRETKKKHKKQKKMAAKKKKQKQRRK
jgi:hypothetical protein